MAASRSLKITSEGQSVVRRALIDSQLDSFELADSVQVSLATVKRFMAGRAIDRKIFVQICEALNLEWLQIVDTSLIPGGGETTKINVYKKELSDTVVPWSSTPQSEDPNLILTGTFRISQTPIMERFGKHLEGLLTKASIVINQQQQTVTIEGTFRTSDKILIKAALEQFSRYLASSHITYFEKANNADTL